MSDNMNTQNNIDPSRSHSNSLEKLAGFKPLPHVNYNGGGPAKHSLQNGGLFNSKLYSSVDPKNNNSGLYAKPPSFNGSEIPVDSGENFFKPLNDDGRM